jgi:hypothetical protein
MLPYGERPPNLHKPLRENNTTDSVNFEVHATDRSVESSSAQCRLSGRLATPQTAGFGSVANRRVIDTLVTRCRHATNPLSTRILSPTWCLRSNKQAYFRQTSTDRDDDIDSFYYYYYNLSVRRERRLVRVARACGGAGTGDHEPERRKTAAVITNAL